MLKKLLLFSSFVSVLLMHPMDQTEIAKKRYVVYSHAFGDDGWGKNDFRSLGDPSAPVYPDAPGGFPNAVFYTKPAVHTLADHLHDITQKEDCDGITFIGRSCGAGTGFNLFAKLVNYDKNPAYFDGSKIRSQADANKIMNAINKGAIIQVVPFLSLRKANAVAIPSAALAGATVVAATTAACYFGPSFCEGNVEPEVAKMGFLAAGLCAGYVLSDYIKNVYARAIVRWIVPPITKFDPHHEEPLQSVEQLRGKLSCPILLQCAAHDRVLENPDNDTVKMYDALKSDKTHILITENGWHNDLPQEFFDELGVFKKMYLDEYKNVNQSQKVKTQPSVEQLRKQIYARKSFFDFNKNAFLGGAALAAIPVVMAAAYNKVMLPKE